MPCYHPIKGYKSRSLNDSGKRSVVFNIHEGYVDLPVSVPCGRCIGCRLDRSRQWAVRCVHEASLYSKNCFITLTFDDSHLLSNLSLVKSDFQNFMKRLRKRFGSGVRYFHCGEYGTKFSRPHHHACLFNFDFPDKVLWADRSGVKLYRSECLEGLWPFGFSTIGSVTFDSAAYVARYIVKKINGPMAVGHYGDRVPEYITMSRRPGIARGWYDKFSADVFPADFVVMRGVKCKVPKYYDRIYELTNPEEYGKLVLDRMEAFNVADHTPDRLAVREVVAKARLGLKSRSYESVV
nr:MAG: replication initiator protein [Microviridae sp.]